MASTTPSGDAPRASSAAARQLRRSTGCLAQAGGCVPCYRLRSGCPPRAGGHAAVRFITAYDVWGASCMKQETVEEL